MPEILRKMLPVSAGLLLLAGCSSGNYVGSVVPESGQPARCGASARGVLTIEKSHFVFAPDEGVLTVAGQVEADGRLHGVGAGSGSAPLVADRPLSPQIVFDGRLARSGIEGRLNRAGCRFRVSLQGR